MKCGHNDCFSCPYSDCIGEIGGGKVGRKALSPEERKRRKQAYNARYHELHKQDRHDRYMRESEGLVKRRYRTKNYGMASTDF